MIPIISLLLAIPANVKCPHTGETVASFNTIIEAVEYVQYYQHNHEYIVEKAVKNASMKLPLKSN